MKKYYFTLFLSISITVGFSQVPETFEEYAFVEALLKEEVRLKRTMTNVEVNKLIGAYGDIHFKVENNTLIQTYEGRTFFGQEPTFRIETAFAFPISIRVSRETHTNGAT